MYQVTLDKFEGPLDLLLQLIEKEKLDICQISLAKITDAYVSQISKLNLSGDEMAEFLLIAAKLLYLKSKELLPNAETEEEETEIADLEARLIEYQKYKEAAKKLGEILESGNRSFARKAKNEQTVTFLPPKDLSHTKLFAIFEEVISKLPEEKETEVIQQVKVSLEERRDIILKKIKTQKKISFKHLLVETKTKTEVIVTFLAILEMIKQKEIKVSQNNNFADFTIEGVK